MASPPLVAILMGSGRDHMRSLTADRLLWGAFLILLFLLSWTRVADYDFWWHLNLGRQIWTEGSPVVADAFSFTFAGQPQFNAEWLADLGLYLAYAVGGIPAVNLCKFLILAATFYCLSRAARERLAEEGRVSPVAIVVTLVVILFAIRFRLFVRPFLFSYLFVALFFWILSVYRNSRDSRLLWLLLVAELIWANTSKGLFYGPLLVGLWVGADLAGRRFDRKLAAALAGVFLASLANPDGFGPYRILFGFAGGEEQVLVGEHQPLSTMLLWGGGFSYTWGFQLLAGAGLCYLLWWGRRDLRAWVLYPLFLLPAVQMIRMIDFFSLASIFFATPLLGRLVALPAVARLAASRALPVALAVLIVVLGGVSAAFSRSYVFGATVKPENIPAGAVAFLRDHGVQGRVFASFPFGGYVAWQLPGTLVYIDGRMNQLFPQAHLKKYFGMIHTPENFAAEREKWGFDIAVLEYDFLSGGRHFPAHLMDSPDWAVVYWDDHSAVCVRRTPAFAELIGRFGYRLLHPAFNGFEYLTKKLREERSPRLLDDARHDLALNPSNQEPRLAYVFLLYSMGARRYQEEILRGLDACLELPPELAMEHSARGMILLQAGRREEAAAAARRALQLDPGDKAGLSLKERLGGL